MTNTERIQAHNAELREAIGIAESLPEADGESEGMIGTWVLNDTIEKLPSGSYNLEFSSNGIYFEGIRFGTLGPPVQVMWYQGYSNNLAYSFEDTSSYGVEPGWQNDGYRTLNVIKEPSEEVATWLKANGKKKKDAYNEVWQFGYDAGYNYGYTVGFDEGYQANEEILSELMEWSLVTWSTYCDIAVLNKHTYKFLHAIIVFDALDDQGGLISSESIEIVLDPDTSSTYTCVPTNSASWWNIEIREVRFSVDGT